jgi:hypothetical protein
MTDSNRFAFFDLPPNANGHTAFFLKDAAFVGSRSAVMERVIDSRARSDSLTLINDAAHAKRDLQAIREDKRALAEGWRALEDAKEEFNRMRLADALAKMDSVTARFDAHEQEEKVAAQRAFMDQLTHAPTGELHELAPVSDPLGTVLEEDDVGLEGVTATRPTVDPEELSHPPKPTTQPISVQLNNED